MIDASDVALVFEGGGMRNSYTAPVPTKFIEEGVSFGWVGGISAGASHTANFLSGDSWRTRHSFTDFAADKQFGGWGSLARGRGYFNGAYIYEGSEEALPYDFAAFESNPAAMHIEALRADTGETVAWNRPDIDNPGDLMVRVRASSTIPMAMIPPRIDGVEYVDGAMGTSGGLLIDAAEQAGYTKFAVICSRPRDYRKPEVSRPRAIRRLLRTRPEVAEAMITRPARYNAAKDRILELERDGKAQVFFPETMPVSTGERAVAKLGASYQAGERQFAQEWDSWREFLLA